MTLFSNRKPALLALGAFIAGGAFAAPAAHAQVMITYSVAGAGPYQTMNDTLNLTGVSGATAILTPGIAQILGIGTADLNLQYSLGNLTQVFNANRAITLNGITQTLFQDATISVTTAQDQVSVSGGTTTTFDLGSGNFVDVTPIDATFGPFVFAGTYSNPINATFVLRQTAVPEPSQYAMGGMLGASLLFGMVKARRRTSKKATATA